MQRLVSKAEDGGGTRQDWLDCLGEIVEVNVPLRVELIAHCGSRRYRRVKCTVASFEGFRVRTVSNEVLAYPFSTLRGVLTARYWLAEYRGFMSGSPAASTFPNLARNATKQRTPWCW